MRRSVLIVCFGLWLCSPAQAEPSPTQPPPSPAPAAHPPRTQTPERGAALLPEALGVTPRAGRLGRSAALFGVVSAGLLWGGAIAIAWVDASSDTERITRGLHLGFAAVAPPLVAFASFLERRRSGVSGVPTMQGFGWALYSFAIAGEVIGFYNAFHDIPTERWTTLLSGALGTLSVLAHSFDAFLCAREARMQRYRFAASPLGIFVRF